MRGDPCNLGTATGLKTDAAARNNSGEGLATPVWNSRTAPTWESVRGLCSLRLRAQIATVSQTLQPFTQALVRILTNTTSKT